jgi:hypothetical protein
MAAYAAAKQWRRIISISVAGVISASEMRRLAGSKMAAVATGGCRLNIVINAGAMQYRENNRPVIFCGYVNQCRLASAEVKYGSSCHVRKKLRWRKERGMKQRHRASRKLMAAAKLAKGIGWRNCSAYRAQWRRRKLGAAAARVAAASKSGTAALAGESGISKNILITQRKKLA